MPPLKLCQSQTNLYPVNTCRLCETMFDFNCPYCVTSSYEEKSIILHLKEKHKINHGELGPKLFRCLQCDYKTTKKYNFVRHIKTTHGTQELPCEFCDKVFGRKDTLNAHIKKNHTIFQCPECDYITRRKYNISRHMKVHENKSERKEQNILDDIIFEMQEYNRKIELGRKIKEIMDKNPQFNENGLSKDNKEALEIFKHQ